MTSKHTLLNTFAGLFILLSFKLASAAIPSILNYQGHLTDSSGVPIDGPVNMVLALYDVETGGTALWSDSQSVTVNQGVFSVELGSGASLFPPSLFETPLWIGLSVAGDTEMSPRRAINSAGFSFKARDADTLEGISAASLDQSGALITHTAAPSDHHVKTTSFTELSDTADDAQIPDSVTRDSELGSHESDASVHHAATDTLPWSSITDIPAGFADDIDDVSSGGITEIIAGTGLSGGGTSATVTVNMDVPLNLSSFSDATIAGTNINGAGGIGIRGVVTPASPLLPTSGLRGENKATNHIGYGVYGSQAGSGSGVYGYAPGGRGIYGRSDSGAAGYFSSGANNTNASSIHGILSATSGGIGAAAIRGENNATGNSGYGVRGTHGGGGDGVAGYSPDGRGVSGKTDTGTAGYFTSSSTDPGDVALHGILTSGGIVSIAVLGENMGNSTGGVGVFGKHGSFGDGVRGSSSSGRGVYGKSDTGTAGLFSSSSGNGLIVSSGNVGIGTSFPTTNLHIVHKNDATLADATTGNIVSGDVTGLNIVIDNNEVMARNNGVKSKLFLNKDSDYVVVPGLEITGGSDLVEPFDVAFNGEILPGMVVSIDPKASGKLLISTKELDRTVAGIISGANGIRPGLSMVQEGTIADGFYPIALTGRLYALADASYGTIEPGDLLTTSNTPGHVRKVTDHLRAHGAIVGKAMTHLDYGTGHVLILVGLQ